jgi:DUF1016 N-terminal domain
MTARKPTQRKDVVLAGATPIALISDVRALILQAREGVARAVDSALTTLYWHIGRRIVQDVLKEKRAGYGEEIVSALGRQLEQEFGRGFSGKSLHHMIRFAEAFPDEQIVSALRRQLTWTHFKHLIYVDDELNRTFYAEMSRVEDGRRATGGADRQLAVLLDRARRCDDGPDWDVVERRGTACIVAR